MDAMKEAGFPAGPSEEWTARVENMVMARLGQEPPHPPARLALLSNHEELGPFRNGRHQFGKKKAAELEALLLPWQLPPLEPKWSAEVWAYFAGQFWPGDDSVVRYWVDENPAHAEAFEARFAAWEDLGWLPDALVVRPESAWEELSAIKPAALPKKRPGLPATHWLLRLALPIIRRAAVPASAYEVQPHLRLEWKGREMIWRGEGNLVVKAPFWGIVAKDRLEWQPGIYGISAGLDTNVEIKVKQGEVLLISRWERFQAISGEELKKSGQRWFKND